MKHKVNIFHMVMWGSAIGSGILLLLFLLLHYIAYAPIWEPLAITFGTCFYHFSMRLLVGSILHHARIDTDHKWFQQAKFETPLYTALKIHKRKSGIPTYNPGEFSLETRTPSQILRAMCRSELVHEWIIVLSFVPLLFVPMFGAFWVFLLTSVAAACYDLQFVLLQRYNRPRIRRLAKRHEAREKSHAE